MKIRICSLFLSILCLFSMVIPAMATDSIEASVPVTLTVVNTVNKVSVTVPAALPVSVVNGEVKVATNVVITNNATNSAVRVTGVRIQSGTYNIGNYNNYDPVPGTIALSINGCGTTGEGNLTINDVAFPIIAAGADLPINYDVKVTAFDDVENTAAAIVIFTLETA